MSRQVSFGALEENEEEDFFKEFAIDDLDAAPTRPAHSRSSLSKQRGMLQ